MKTRRVLTLLLIVAFVLSNSLAFAASPTSDNQLDESIISRAIEKLKPEETEASLSRKLEKFFNEDDEVRIIVELDSEPTIQYATRMNKGYSALSVKVVSDLERNIEKEQQQVKQKILSSKINMDFIHSFKTTFNGFSGMVKVEDIKAIEKLPNVKKVYLSNEYERPEIEPSMNTSNDMIGALPTWDLSYKGEGTVIAIIDTGIDPRHRDMVLSEGTEPKLTQEDVEGLNLLGRYFTEKVPYGYNYYDLNNEILDLGPDPSMHGMHVAGTAGANGDPDNGGIKGVAPESQLLAMKVFSNDPIYGTTFSDIYLVAIDEAVRLGADVLNMSLGSTASFYIPDSAEDIAITNATNNGIVCSVSAGNSATITDGWTETNYGYPWRENPDIGVVGAPSLNKDTISVASIENTHQQSKYLVYEIDGVEHNVPMAVAGNINPAEALPGLQEFVDGGSGHPTELTNVAGKVALIVRGGLTPPFVEKIQNAQAAGAIGVIIRNHENGGEGLVNMQTPADQSIPAVFIGHQGGLALMGLEEKLLTFSNDTMLAPNPAGNTMSDFTSWGVTPSLELKPEITAPGGQIYSTLQDDEYGTMSGTSMAAPHVAGGSALVLEYIKENPLYESLSLAEQTRLAKVLLMNTANVVYDGSNIEVSPRRQGAGLMDLYGAVTTPVRLVDATTNEAKVELKDFEDTTITMDFRAINDSDEEATYDVNVAVITDYIHSLGLNLLEADYIYDAIVDAPASITVPANDEYEFSVTIDIGEDETIYRNMFVEGFVTLVDPNDENPSLSVPYVGFYGDWGEPNILDGMNYIDSEGESYFEASGMIYWDAEGGGYYYSTPRIFMNPGTEAGYLEGTGNVTPYLSFMRNAEFVNYKILDEEGNHLRTILMQQFVRKNFIDGGAEQPVRMISAAEWDGTVNGEVLPDGDYFYEIEAKVHYEGAEIQSKRIPITIDTVGPEVTDLAYDPVTGMLNWNSIDAAAGILGFMFEVNGQEVEEIVNGEEGVTSYSVSLRNYITEAGEYEIKVFAVDNILNISMTVLDYTFEVYNPYIFILQPGLLDVYNSNEITFEGYVGNDLYLVSVLIDSVEADLEFVEEAEVRHPDNNSVLYTGPAFRFSKTLTMEDGYQEVSIESISATGLTGSLTRRFYVDTTSPELDITIASIDTEAKTAELQIRMQDNFDTLILYQGDSQIYTQEGPLVTPAPADETISVTVNYQDVDTFVFTLHDVAGNMTVMEITIDESLVEPIPMSELPTNTVIVGEEAFDMEYLNNNADAQMKLIEAYNGEDSVYIKLDDDTIVSADGSVVSIEVLPETILYYDADGNISVYSK
ncbi:S8 family serine peptidase [Alkaliphilus serpentinus]|uniref:S8 family serine peptidase n=1 Tax=Alkaliphilus serpentinus TaxID=1482731 RepID=UPI0018657037|nr:S8 family serine peptidase [Alkaliphilus serpentinus]